MIRLRELREAKHINQQKLAMELNVTQAAISKYELGLSTPDINMLKNIASYFRVSVDYLIGFSDNPVQCSKSDLTYDELEIINMYRNMTAVQKASAQGYMHGLLNS